jgi:hypothetical protein
MGQANGEVFRALKRALIVGPATGASSTRHLALTVRTTITDRRRGVFLQLIILQHCRGDCRQTQKFFTDSACCHERSTSIQLMDLATQSLPPILLKSLGVLAGQNSGSVTNVLKKFQKRCGHTAVGFNGDWPKMDVLALAALLHGKVITSGVLVNLLPFPVTLFDHFLFR